MGTGPRHQQLSNNIGLDVVLFFFTFPSTQLFLAQPWYVFFV